MAFRLGISTKLAATTTKNTSANSVLECLSALVFQWVFGD